MLIISRNKNKNINNLRQAINQQNLINVNNQLSIISNNLESITNHLLNYKYNL